MRAITWSGRGSACRKAAPRDLETASAPVRLLFRGRRRLRLLRGPGRLAGDLAGLLGGALPYGRVGQRNRGPLLVLEENLLPGFHLADPQDRGRLVFLPLLPELEPGLRRVQPER